MLEPLQRIYFNPLPPYGGRLTRCLCFSAVNFISIHSLRMEGDSVHTVGEPYVLLFQSTPSVWRETGHDAFPSGRGRFQSTPSVWRETSKAPPNVSLFSISIHSLRMEGDCHFYHSFLFFCIFQSTPSVWRETGTPFLLSSPSAISIHSLRMEGDQHLPTAAHLFP